jgi:stalled ribosome rescue protein Dom34
VRDDVANKPQETPMTAHFHALVWIDHREAKVFHFDADSSNSATIHNSHAHQNLHHKANSSDSGHVPVDKEYLQRVVKEMAAAGAILVVGPGSAKTELNNYIQQHDPQLAAKISAVEASDHPTDGQLLAHARKFFVADDRMHWQARARG